MTSSCKYTRASKIWWSQATEICTSLHEWERKGSCIVWWDVLKPPQRYTSKKLSYLDHYQVLDKCICDKHVNNNHQMHNKLFCDWNVWFYIFIYISHKMINKRKEKYYLTDSYCSPIISLVMAIVPTAIIAITFSHTSLLDGNNWITELSFAGGSEHAYLISTCIVN